MVANLQLAIVIGAGIIMFAWILFALVGPRKTDAPNALAVLRYGSAIQTISLVLALAPPCLLAWVAWVSPWVYPHQALVPVACFGSGIVLSGLLLIEVIRTQIVVSEEGLTRHSPWTGTAFLRWAEVKSVSYSALNRWFVVKADSATIRVSRHLDGVRGFAEMVQRKVAVERTFGATGVLDQLR